MILEKIGAKVLLRVLLRPVLAVNGETGDAVSACGTTSYGDGR